MQLHNIIVLAFATGIMNVHYTQLETRKQNLLWTSPTFQQTMTLSRGQGGQKYEECMKMSTPNLALVLLFVHTEVECGKGLFK